MQRPVGLLVLLVIVCGALACKPPPQPPPEEKADPSIPTPAPTGRLAAAPPLPPGPPPAATRGLVGPTETLDVEHFRKRRRALLDRLGGSAALIQQTARWDGARSGADFYYLTGITDEQGAQLLLDPRARIFKEALLLPGRDVEREHWEGERAGLPSRALELATGIGRIMRTAAAGFVVLDACRRGGSVAFVGMHAPPPADVPPELVLYRQVQERLPSCELRDLGGLVAKMRMVKEPEELALMRKAIEHTAAGHRAALAFVEPGVREYQVKAAVEDAMRRSGSRHLAFDSITGSGPNAAVLHYPKDDRVMNAGELIVVDIGAEAEHYAADITRTLPVGGKFSDEQREIYQIVLAAQAAGIDKARAGATLQEIDQATRKVIADAGYYDQYLHFCCHYVGLQVHDVGYTDQPLPVGAVITVEPGIYLPQRGFGVRIEDQVLITDGPAELLTGALPKDPAAVEKAMAEAKK